MSAPQRHDTPQAADICAEEGHEYALAYDAYYLWKYDQPNACRRCGAVREP